MAPPKPHRRPRRPAVQTERPEVRFHVFGTSGTVWIQRTDTLSKRVAIALRWLIDDSPVLALADQNRRPSEAHLPRWQVSRKDGFGQSSVRLQFAIARGLAPADIAAVKVYTAVLPDEGPPQPVQHLRDVVVVVRHGHTSFLSHTYGGICHSWLHTPMGMCNPLSGTAPETPGELPLNEFGRTPGDVTYLNGRDHYQYAMTVLAAGGGIKGGNIIGKTDETGAKVIDSGWGVKRSIYMEDIATTIYSAMGIDWTKTVKGTPSGRDFYYIEPFATAQFIGAREIARHPKLVRPLVNHILAVKLALADGQLELDAVAAKLSLEVLEVADAQRIWRNIDAGVQAAAQSLSPHTAAGSSAASESSAAMASRVSPPTP